MRLIDADMLKKYMLNNGKEVERFLQYIDEQPTVYNADKVIREYIKKMRKIDDAEGKADQSWIPCSERFPDDDRYILVSFENSTLPDIARYERDDEGGAFYPGDDEKSYSSYGLFVNAWMPLPEPYKEKKDGN